MVPDGDFCVLFCLLCGPSREEEEVRAAPACLSGLPRPLSSWGPCVLPTGLLLAGYTAGAPASAGRGLERGRRRA